jgi:hypothetical protein
VGTDGAKKNALVFYTTSQTDYPGQKRPRQYLFVDEAKAKELGQKVAFHIDASRIALVPLTPAYFPDLALGPIRTFGRDPELARKVTTRQAELIAAGFPIDKVNASRTPAQRPK